MPVAPYGTALQEALRSGDLRKMEQTLTDAKRFVATSRGGRELQSAITELEQAVARLRTRRP